MTNRGVNIEAGESPSARPSRAGRRHAALARQAIAFVRAELEVRERAHPRRPAHHVSRDDMSAWLSGRFEQLWMVGNELEAVAQRTDDFAAPAWMSRLSRLAATSELASGAGAQAALAFTHLYELGVRPLDFMHVPGRGYAFVLLGRAEPIAERAATEQDEQRVQISEPRQAEGALTPERWGSDAVICDPFHGLVFRQPDLLHTDYYDDYHPAESQLHLPRPRGDHQE